MTWFSTLFYTFLIIRAAFGTAEVENEMFLYSTSVGSMSKLVQLENKLMGSLQVVAKDMQQKLNMIRLYQQMLKRSAEDSSEKQEEYVANPLNAFALLRRLQQDWPKWLTYLKTQPEIEEMQQQLQNAPNENDLQTAIKGLLRIERIYDLEASHMAEGLLLGKQYDSFLTSPDCVVLADNLFNHTEYSRSTHWYRTAIRLYKKPYGKLFGRVLGLKRKGLNRKYAQAIVYEPDVSQEPQVAGVEPEWKDNVDNVIKQLVSQSSSDKIQNMVDKYLAVNEQIFIEQRAKHKAKPNAVEKGCRGLWPKRKTHPLTCRYVQQNSAYLMLAPLKMEMLSLEPLIQLYHDVLHDSEIEAVKNVTNHRTMVENVASTVKLITLKDAPHTQNINRRITDMSGLDMAQNNTLQLLNFGLGGYLGKQLKLQGNRIATVIFYASDVALGGATIFPRLQLVVKPKRGSALLWYNLNAAGKPDALTRHAVCPVVVGSRWAISKCIEDQQQLPKKLCLA